MNLQYFILLISCISVKATPPIALEWSRNCCSHSAVVQILYASREFRDFLIKNRDYITQNDESSKSAALIGIFDLISKAEIEKKTFVPFGALEPYYEKLGLTGGFTDAWTAVLKPILEDTYTIAQKNPDILPEFEELFVTLNQTGLVVDKVCNPQVVQKDVFRDWYSGVERFKFPHYIYIDWGFGDQNQIKIESSINLLHEYGDIVAQIEPRGSYRIYGILVSGKDSKHIHADIVSNGHWYRCGKDGGSFKNITQIEAKEALVSEKGYLKIGWYVYDPQPDEMLDDASKAFNLLAKALNNHEK